MTMHHDNDQARPRRAAADPAPTPPPPSSQGLGRAVAGTVIGRALWAIIEHLADWLS